MKTKDKPKEEEFTHSVPDYYKTKKPYVGEPMKTLAEVKEVKNIFQRMLVVMDKLKYIKKAAKAPKGTAGLSYSYVTHDSVTRALHEPLTAAGIVCLVNVEEYQSENVIMKTQYGNKENTKVTLKAKISFVNADCPEDRIEVISFGVGIDNADKAFGKALSYATKMIYLKNFLLESGDEEDVESKNDECVVDTTVQIAHADNMMLQLPVDRLTAVEERMQKKFKTKELDKLNFEDLKTVTLFLEDELRKQAAKPKGE